MLAKTIPPSLRHWKSLLLLVFFVWSGSLSAQMVIKGSVRDSKGDAVPNVTVTVLGTKNVTMTNESGFFTIKAKKNDKLHFTSVGFDAKDVIVNKTAQIDIVMDNEVSKAMNEVVVVGYGTMKKKDLTGAISSIRPDKIAEENPKTVQDILRGTPGMVIGLDPSAKSGGTIQIRGQRSVYTDGGHNDPLLILDGMIFYGELSEINPDDIEQIDVLKDASAAAIYGAKSANGVIIITTKKGKQGKPTINLTSNIGATTMGANRPVFSPQGYMQYRQDWYTEASYGTDGTGVYAPYQTGVSKGKGGYYEKPTQDVLDKYGITIDQWRAYSTNQTGASDDQIWAQRLLLTGTTLTNYLAGKSFDWYDHTFRTGFNQDHNISVSGANDKMNYYLSAGYLSNQGVQAGDNYKAVRSNLKVDGKVTPWLEISANVNFQNRTDNGDINDYKEKVDWGQQIINNSPFAAYRDDNGNLEIHPMGDDQAANKGYNYDYNMQYKTFDKGYTVLNSIFSAKVKLPWNITYSFNISPRYQWFHNRYFESTENPDWLAINHGVDRETSQDFDWSMNNTLNWQQTFAGKHTLNITLVQEAEEKKYWEDIIQARNILPTDALGYHETSTGDPLYSSFNSNDTHETADGLLARVFYSYDNRYMLTASVRRDGYSAFGTSNPRATFFSTAFAWTFTNENFFKWKPLNSGKLRLSFGQNGNRSLADPYIALANLANGVGTQGYVDASGNYIQYYYLRIDRMANPHLQWEKTSAYNAGVDLGFLNNRITGTLDYYFMPTTNMIMKQALPSFTGFTSITTNLGEVQNRGFEIGITSQNIQTRKFNWSTTFGYSQYSNTVKHLYGTYVDVLDANGNVVSSKESDDITNGWFIGKPISAIWDYKVTGIWQVNEATEAAKYGQRPGDPKVKNGYTGDDIKNSNGSITPVYNNKDKEFLGQKSAPIMWSMRNNFSYGNFNFSFNMYSYWGHKSVGTSYLNQDNGTSGVTYNSNTYQKKYWTLNNPDSWFARLDAKGPAGITSPNRVYDKSFIRLDNVTFGYTMPGKLISSRGIENLRFYVTARNVAVWKKDKHWTSWDIETEKFAPRIYTFGVNVTF
jgi:TonB-linked SusC/RagA family outer membrane protein